jgi:HD-like signal output (HDOD) protein
VRPPWDWYCSDYFFPQLYANGPDKPGVVATLTGKKERARWALKELPPFSPVLKRVLASLIQENISFVELGDLIEKDTVMAGNILHLVNSALYARRGTVNSVRFALSLLGTDKLRNVVLGMSVARMWNQLPVPASWSMARFNMHSAAVAVFSDLLVQRLPVNYPEGAFIGGLLHDIGSLLIAMGLTEEFGRALQTYENSADGLIECERRILGFTHAELSAEALAIWNLPESIQVAVSYHHAPELDTSTVPDGQMRLSRILDVANRCVNSFGTTVLASPPASGAAAPEILESLGMDRGDSDKILEEFKAEYETIAGFFR